jgi:hypothetical protein
MLPEKPIDAIRKKLQRPIPMQGLERRIFAIVLLVLMSGIILSFLLHDWQYFERSGSLIVVVAIALGWKDHIVLLGNMEKCYHDHFGRLLARLDATRPSGITAGTMHDGKRQAIETGGTNTNADELIVLLRRRLRTMEAGILCLGTVIWGYGSVIGNLIFGALKQTT